MEYTIQMENPARKELRKLPPNVQDDVGRAIEHLKHDLAGDVKKQEGQKGVYRLRVGNYRVLFRLEGTQIVIYRIRIRGKAYSLFLW